MVRINDEEKSHFDAPIEVVWKYLQHPEAHGAAHQNARNRSMKPLSEDSFIVSWEQNVNGNWVKIANKVTVFPPLGMAAEQLEGPMKGSRMFTVYTPRGAKTEVAVFGDMQSAMAPPGQLEPMVRMAWESAYNEDAAGIRAFARK
jgi:hypothetical protein